MARKSKVSNPSVLLNVSGELTVARCVDLWSKATGLKRDDARDDLIATGFTRNLALETYKAANGKPKKAPAKKSAKK